MSSNAAAQTAPFPPLVNDTLLRAVRREPVEHVPVWLHRQAGRYLPEFREERKKHSFFEICRNAELAELVTLQPLLRFGSVPTETPAEQPAPAAHVPPDSALDAAIIFCDILVVPQALGLEVEMRPGVGPVFPNPLTLLETSACTTCIAGPEAAAEAAANDVEADAAALLDTLSPMTSPEQVHERLGYVMEAIRVTRHGIRGHVPLLGFSGGPWTLMAYCIEGRGSKTWSKAKRWFYVCPKAAHRFLDLLTDAIVPYLVEQVRAGAQMLEVFESWAGELTPFQFKEFLLPRLARLAAEVKAQLGPDAAVPMTIFPKGAAAFALEPLLETTSFDVVSLDWTVDRRWASALAKKHGKALQGNLDPCALYGPDDELERAVERMVDEFDTEGWIANLGHGCLPDHTPEKVQAFITMVHRASKRKIKAQKEASASSK